MMLMFHAGMLSGEALSWSVRWLTPSVHIFSTGVWKLYRFFGIVDTLFLLIIFFLF